MQQVSKSSTCRCSLGIERAVVSRTVRTKQVSTIWRTKGTTTLRLALYAEMVSESFSLSSAVGQGRVSPESERWGRRRTHGILEAPNGAWTWGGGDQSAARFLAWKSPSQVRVVGSESAADRHGGMAGIGRVRRGNGLEDGFQRVVMDSRPGWQQSSRGGWRRCVAASTIADMEEGERTFPRLGFEGNGSCGLAWTGLQLFQ